MIALFNENVVIVDFMLRLQIIQALEACWITVVDHFRTYAGKGLEVVAVRYSWVIDGSCSHIGVSPLGSLALAYPLG